MDEPCSALDPIATARIEELMLDLKNSYTIVIVTHNMQQAARVSDYTGFMLLGELVEFGVTRQLFTNPREKRTRTTSRGGSDRGLRSTCSGTSRRARGAQADAPRHGRPGRGPDPARDARADRAGRRSRQEVIDRDRQVNAYDVEVDETCVNLLALHQPAAGTCASSPPR